MKTERESGESIKRWQETCEELTDNLQAVESEKNVLVNKIKNFEDKLSLVDENERRFEVTTKYNFVDNVIVSKIILLFVIIPVFENRER